MEPDAAEYLIACALEEMDSFFGPRRSGEAISGLWIRGRHRREDISFTTYRILVKPFMEASGKKYLGCATVEGESRIALSYVAMNMPLVEASARMSESMREYGIPAGISTDGFRWLYVREENGGPRYERVFDLRPYYIEALDRSRFRAAVPADRRDLTEFSAIMG
jgi:hypothetical protein